MRAMCAPSRLQETTHLGGGFQRQRPFLLLLQHVCSSNNLPGIGWASDPVLRQGLWSYLCSWPLNQSLQKPVHPRPGLLTKGTVYSPHALSFSGWGRLRASVPKRYGDQPPGLPTSVPVLKLKVHLRKLLFLGKMGHLVTISEGAVPAPPLTSPQSLFCWRPRNPWLVGFTSRADSTICFLNFGGSAVIG